MSKKEVFRDLTLLVSSIALIGSASAAQTFAYPPVGRTDDQQRQDVYECHAWAVEQSHYDPTAAPSGATESASPSARSAGGVALGGAALGAAVAAVADEDSGDGARAGATVGLMRQRRAKAAAAEENAKAQKATQQLQQQAAAQRTAYDSARNTCLKARGYTLS